MKERILYLVKIYVIMALIMIVAQTVVAIFNGAPITLENIWELCVSALPGALSKSLVFIAIPLLAVVVSVWAWHWDGIRSFLKVYYAVAAIVVASRLVGITFKGIPVWQILVTIGIILVVALVIYLLLVVATPKEKQHRYRIAEQGIFRNRTRANVGSIEPIRSTMTRMVSTVVGLAIIPLGALLLSNTISIPEISLPSLPKIPTINIPKIAKSSDKDEKEEEKEEAKDSIQVPQYAFFGAEEANTLCADIFNTSSAGNPQNLFNTPQPRQILMVVTDGPEGVAAATAQGVHFISCFANGTDMKQGLASLLSGCPPLPGFSLADMPVKASKMPSLSKSLKAAGYEITATADEALLLKAHAAYLQAIGMERTDTATLVDFFNRAKQTSDKMRFRLLMTRNGAAVAPFINSMKSTEEWKNTLVIVVPSHGKADNEALKNAAYITMAWTGGAVQNTRRVGWLCSQTDVAATLLGQMGIEHNKFAYSRDVMSPQYKRQFALHTFANGFATIDASGFNACQISKQDGKLTTALITGKEGNALQTGMAILQKVAADLGR